MLAFSREEASQECEAFLSLSPNTAIRYATEVVPIQLFAADRSLCSALSELFDERTVVLYDAAIV